VQLAHFLEAPLSKWAQACMAALNPDPMDSDSEAEGSVDLDALTGISAAALLAGMPRATIDAVAQHHPVTASRLPLASKRLALANAQLLLLWPGIVRSSADERSCVTVAVRDEHTHAEVLGLLPAMPEVTAIAVSMPRLLAPQTAVRRAQLFAECASACDAFQHVTTLRIDGSCTAVVRKLLPSLAALPHLSELSLDGSLRECDDDAAREVGLHLGNCAALQGLSIANNELRLPAMQDILQPIVLGPCHKLAALDFSGNLQSMAGKGDAFGGVARTLGHDLARLSSLTRLIAGRAPLAILQQLATEQQSQPQPLLHQRVQHLRVALWVQSDKCQSVLSDLSSMTRLTCLELAMPGDSKRYNDTLAGRGMGLGRGRGRVDQHGRGGRGGVVTLAAAALHVSVHLCTRLQYLHLACCDRPTNCQMHQVQNALFLRLHDFTALTHLDLQRSRAASLQRSWQT
jgi:hypothetical protein